MLLPRRFISFAILLGAVYLSGCHSTQAHSAPAASSAPKTQTLSATPTVSKHLAHDSALTTYNNPTYGLSFRYPRNYLLDDPSDSESDSILEAQQDLAASQPGAVLVSLVSIPSDAYPNTTFVSGELHLVVNPTVTREACQSFITTDDETYRLGSTSTQTLIFEWRQKLSSFGTASLTRDYAAFSNNTCYEFFLDVVTTPNLDADSHSKDTVLPRVLRQFDKIVSSLQFQPPQSLSHPR